MAGRDDQYFWDGAREGHILLRQCAACGEVTHPPQPMCPHCHALEWTTRAASGRGTVYAWLVSRHPSQPDDDPRIVALIDLEEGHRLVSNLVDVDPSVIAVGDPVVATFREVGGVVLPQFVRAEQA